MKYVKNQCREHTDHIIQPVVVICKCVSLASRLECSGPACLTAKIMPRCPCMIALGFPAVSKKLISQRWRSTVPRIFSTYFDLLVPLEYSTQRGAIAGILLKCTVVALRSRKSGYATYCKFVLVPLSQGNGNLVLRSCCSCPTITTLRRPSGESTRAISSILFRTAWFLPDARYSSQPRRTFGFNWEKRSNMEGTPNSGATELQMAPRDVAARVKTIASVCMIRKRQRYDGTEEGKEGAVVSV